VAHCLSITRIPDQLLQEIALPASSVTAERFLHPLHAILLAFPVAFSFAAVLSDITYLNSAVVQWSHFSAWLIAGTALFGGFVLAWAIVAFLLARRSGRRGRALLYLVLIAVMWVLSVLNSFHHARDGWGSVGALGLTLSIVTALLALAAAWIGHSAVRREVAR
jgi:uncharacterized membrane protein